MNDRLWELLAKYWSDQITPEEKAEMERMLLEHPDHWLKTGMMQQINWELHPLLAKKRADRITDRIIGRTGRDEEPVYRSGKRRVNKRYRRWITVTAFALILAIGGAGMYLWKYKSSGNRLVWQQVTTTDGMRTTLRLADGSELWINAGSTLRYPENFNEKAREVYLTGEAYFEVKHDPDRPFIIHTASMNVKVLGTVLDVRSYEDEDYAETSLIKGAVAVTLNNGRQRQQIYLKPQQKIVVQNPSARVEDAVSKLSAGGNSASPDSRLKAAAGDVKLEPIKPVDGDIIPETAWKENMLLFHDEPLQSLARRLERWYGVTITIGDSSLARRRFTGRADNVSLEKLLHILQMIKPFSYTIYDKNVVIN